MIIAVPHTRRILLVLGHFELDKFLIWRVLWESITKKGRLDETAIVDYQ